MKSKSRAKPHKRLEVAAPASMARRNKTTEIHSDKEVRPEQIIPLGDDDFKDF